ncbi:uncharacterized protein LODBEIA_P35250 [Lodderomyces beijingensis]|uniref:Uridine kinase n=1 Tax=Lodderomyces beijingensis TaxID=1775926 RepID=A0ABP0ZQV2_9ASCO
MAHHPRQRRSSRIAPLQHEDSSFINLAPEGLQPADSHHTSAHLPTSHNINDSIDQLTMSDHAFHEALGTPPNLHSRLLDSPVQSSSAFSVQSSPRPNFDSFGPRSSTSFYDLTRTSSVNTLNHSSYIPPWTQPYIIGIAGNSGSGKTSISQQIIQGINQPWTVLLSFDNFYKNLSAEESKRAFENEYDFDTPESLDLEALVDTVKALKSGGKATIPVYSFAKHARTDKTNTIYGANVVIIEGLYALYDERLLSMMDLKIYVDTDLDICLARRLTRDILYRGRDLEGAIKQWEKFVKPNAVKHLNPTMNNADLVIPRGLDNSIAINLMIKHIKNQLALKSAKHLRNLRNVGVDFDFNVDEYKNIGILPVTNQLCGINTILFNKDTSREDFIFFFNRISGILIEFAQQNFFDDYESKVVTTPQGFTCQGLTIPQTRAVAVNIIRSGDCFMTALKKSFSELAVGKMLIQSDSSTGEPQLHYEKLPSAIDQIGKIMLFDSQIISGAGVIMAIQVLIDHKVKEEDIIVISYLCTEIGVRRVTNVFPKVKIVIGKLSSMDLSDDCAVPWYNQEKSLDSHWHFRNRFIDSLYFGTE